MKIKENKAADGTITLTVSATKAEVDEAFDKAALSFAQQMNLNPGESSSIAEIAKEKLGIQDLDSIVREKAVDYLSLVALDKKGIIPLSPPDNSGAALQAKRDSDFEFSVTVIPKPHFELNSYEPVSITVEAFEFTPDEIDEEVTRTLDSFAHFAPESPRPVESGDCCLIDLRAKQDGQELKGLEYDGLTYVMGAGYMPPDFDAQLIGMQVGETKTFEIHLPGPQSDANGQSEAIECTVTVNGIQKRVMPDLTDAWVAENFPPNETVADLRRSTEERMLDENREGYDSYLRQAVIKELAKRFDAAIPDEAYKATQDTMMNQMRLELQQQGMTLEDYMEQNGGEQQFQMQLLMQIRENLIQSYSLDAVFKHHGLEITDEDIDNACKSLNPQNPQAMKEQMLESGYGYALREMAERMKASAYLLDTAIIKTRA